MTIYLNYHIEERRLNFSGCRLEENGDYLNNVRRKNSTDLKMKIKYLKDKINKFETEGNKTMRELVGGINICIKRDLTNRRSISTV
jgi:hypothetical protein